jgi:hypothetical protein
MSNWVAEYVYRCIELHKGRRGTVVEIRLQPAPFHITVSDSSTWREQTQSETVHTDTCRTHPQHYKTTVGGGVLSNTILAFKGMGCPTLSSFILSFFGRLRNDSIYRYPVNYSECGEG